MKYCSNCGSQLNEGADVCLNCGKSVNSRQTINIVNDSGGFGYGCLGFFIPLVGLILYLVWKNEKPNTAKAAGIGALIGFILTVISYVIYIFAILNVSYY
jgi:drug/metabolite transporter (DMT)-like permease